MRCACNAELHSLARRRLEPGGCVSQQRGFRVNSAEQQDTGRGRPHRSAHNYRGTLGDLVGEGRGLSASQWPRGRYYGEYAAPFCGRLRACLIVAFQPRCLSACLRKRLAIRGARKHACRQEVYAHTLVAVGIKATTGK